MSGAKSGLTLPWLWVAIIIAYLALGFMLPPFDAPMRELGKTKVQVEPAPDQKEKGEIVFQ